MTDQPTPAPDDDPAKRAIDLIRAESEDRVLPWSHAETIVRAAYDPLIARVRELVGEILRIQSYGRVTTSLSEKMLLQQIADAIEVVRKERAVQTLTDRVVLCRIAERDAARGVTDEQAITAKVIQSQQEMIRKLTPCGPVNLQVREKAAIQVLRAARSLTTEGADKAWQFLDQGWRDHWLMEADCVIAILADEQEGRS